MANSHKAPDNRDPGQGTTSSAAQGVKETAANLTHQAGQAASNLGQKAQDTASNLAQKARDTASDLGHRAQELAGTAGERTDDALGVVGHGMSNLAGTIRQNVPREGMLGSAAGSVAEGLEAGGRYLSEHGMSEIGDDVGRLVRQHPLPALLTVFGIGVLLGTALRR
jgi:ElaB/YqjD/DUF883 family membrane-anchored ribosome-binding protein